MAKAKATAVVKAAASAAKGTNISRGGSGRLPGAQLLAGTEAEHCALRAAISPSPRGEEGGRLVKDQWYFCPTSKIVFELLGIAGGFKDGIVVLDLDRACGGDERASPGDPYHFKITKGTDYFDVHKSAFATALHLLLTGSIASDMGPASVVSDDPSGGGSGGSTIKDTTTSDNISNTHPSHPTSAGSDSTGQDDDNGTPKPPLPTQGPVPDGGGGCGGGACKGTIIIGGSSGSDPPLTELCASGQGLVLEGGGGGGTSKGTSTGGSSGSVPPSIGPYTSDKGPASGVDDDPGGGGSGGSTIKDTITSGISDNICNTHPSHLTLAGSDSSNQGDDNGTHQSPPLTQVCQSDPKASTSSKLPPADKDRSGHGGDSGGGSDPPLTEPSASGQGSVSGGGDVCGGGTSKGTSIGGSSGNDPPLTEPNAYGQGSVSGGDGGCGDGTFKGIIIGGSNGSDPPFTEPSALGQGFVSGVGDTGDGNGGSTFKGIIISGGSDPELCSRADPASYRGNSGGGAEGPLPRIHSAPCA